MTACRVIFCPEVGASLPCQWMAWSSAVIRLGVCGRSHLAWDVRDVRPWSVGGKVALQSAGTATGAVSPENR